jgi:hypothetical protein
MRVTAIQPNISLRELSTFDSDTLLTYADGPGSNSSARERLVFKRRDGVFSFKVISNRFLAKKG